MALSHGSLDRRARQRIGVMLRSKYKLERVLGVGGMAAVYLGVHRNGFRVAVKMLHAELSFDAGHRARFIREGYVANAIDHRGAVRVLDDDIADDGSAFLVMELLEGQTLHARRLRRGGRLPHREAAALGVRLLDVLAAAHDKGVVHRDIKPENIFLTAEGALKVLDFGIARFNDAPAVSATLTGRSIGTPAFMPPEQALGRKNEIDARTDLWAAGATLFTLLSGRFVHAAETVEELIVRTATQPGRKLRDVAPDAPPAIAEVIDRALAFAQADRWPSARAMQQALEQAYVALYGEPSAALVVLADLVDPDAESDPASSETMEERSEQDLSPLGQTANPGAAEIGLDLTEPAHNEALASGSDDVRSAPTRALGAQRPIPTPTPTPSPSSPASSPAPPNVDVRATAGTVRPPPRSRRLPAIMTGAFIALCVGIGALAAKLQPHTSLAASSAAPSAAPPRECTRNAECIAKNQGKPAVCRPDDGVCVPLETEQCHVLAGEADIANDATVWFGVMFPQRGPDAAMWGQASVNGVDLMRRDVMEVASGLPPARPGGPRRPIGLVVCDDAQRPERAAEHLVNDVHVPAILGFARSKEVLDLATSLFIPRGVLALASNTASMLSTLPHAPGEPRLVFRTTTSATMTVEPDAALVAQVIEPELRKTPGALLPDEPMRVALAQIDNASGLSRADLYIGTLRYNGKTVAQNGDNFRQIIVPDDMTSPDPDKDLRAAAAAIVAYKPHVVLFSGPSAKLIVEVEKALPERERLRPRYVDTTILEPALFRYLKDKPELRRRILTVDTASGTEVITKFVMRYNQLYSPKVTAQTGTFAPYDAAYLLAYAAAAVGEEPLTGKALARAITRMLPPGQPIDVGPAGIYPAFHALSSGKNIDLRGTTTSLDFDLETGDATADFAVFCLTPGGRGDAGDTVESGLTYDARAHRFEGTMRCP